MLLEAYVGLVQCPADPFQIRADVEEVARIRMKASENALLADRDAQIYGELQNLVRPTLKNDSYDPLLLHWGALLVDLAQYRHVLVLLQPSSR